VVEQIVHDLQGWDDCKQRTNVSVEQARRVGQNRAHQPRSRSRSATGVVWIFTEVKSARAESLPASRSSSLGLHLSASKREMRLPQRHRHQHGEYTPWYHHLLHLCPFSLNTRSSMRIPDVLAGGAVDERAVPGALAKGRNMGHDRAAPPLHTDATDAMDLVK